jgi:hypothetical protein
MKFEPIIIIKNINLQDQILTNLWLNTKQKTKVVAAIVISNPIKWINYGPSDSQGTQKTRRIERQYPFSSILEPPNNDVIG